MYLRNKQDVFLLRNLILLFILLGISYFKFHPQTIDHDETGQFFIAKGTNHFSPLNETSGTFYEMLKNNREFNLDPGGFTLILRCWSSISNNLLWLKLLPFLFFIVLALFTALATFELTENIAASLFSVYSLILIDNLFIQLNYLRPYSMEYAGAICAFYLVVKYTKTNTINYLWIISILVTIFEWSRYTFSINSILFGLFCLKECISHKISIKSFFLLQAGPLLSFILIWFITLRYQNPQLRAPGLYQENLLYSHPELLTELIQWNFFNARTIPYFLLFLFVLIKHHFKTQLIPPFIRLFILWAIGIHLILICFSILGASPWDVRSQRSAYIYFISIFSICLLGSQILELIKKAQNLTSYNSIFNVIIIATIILFSIEVYRKWGYTRDMSDVIIKVNYPNSLSLDNLMYAPVKYHFLYGTLTSLPLAYFNRLYFINPTEINKGSVNNYPIYINKWNLSLIQSELKNFNFHMLSGYQKGKSFPYPTYIVITSPKQPLSLHP